LEPGSYINEDEFEFLLITNLHDHRIHQHGIDKLMNLKVDDGNWYRNSELLKLRDAIKIHVGWMSPKLQHPGVKRIRKKILELQKIGSEGKGKLVNRWEILKKNRQDGILKDTEDWIENKNKEKRHNDWIAQSKDYEKLKLITHEHLRKIKNDKKEYEEKRIKDKIFEKEDKKLTRDFNKKLKKIITSIPPNDPLPLKDIIDQLSKLIPALNNWKETDVTSRWGYFCHVTELFYWKFPNERLDNDFKTMELKLIDLEKISDPSTYTKTSY